LDERKLAKKGNAQELQIASLRRHGTLRKPVTIWVVRVGDDLYVRSWRGSASTRFRGIQDRREGRITAGGVNKDVLFVEADDDVNNAIDAAYRSKYGRYGDSYVIEMIRPEARVTTLKLVPR
jgi:hypothetical protein